MSFTDFWTGFDDKPSLEEAKQLVANFDAQCAKAADALAQADVLVLFTGAGFSADSGLAVYADVAKVPAYQERGLDYCDICQPHWLESDPELFYGFWGQCFNDYRKTKPHEGYDIIARWRDDKNNARGKNTNDAVAERSIPDEIRERVRRKMELRHTFEEDGVMRYSAYEVPVTPAGAFYSFTSNVDAHSYDTFDASEIHECHGNVETWQCSTPYCISGVWRAPADHHFVVDSDTMLAPPTRAPQKAKNSSSTGENKAQACETSDEGTVAHIGQTKGTGERSSPLKHMPPQSIDNPGSHADESWKASSNWPKCGHCLSPARPAVLMFGDFGWRSDVAQAKRWSLWKEALIDLCEKRAQLQQALEHSVKSKSQDELEFSSPPTSLDTTIRVCLIEIGCGLQVPTCRSASERLLRTLQQKGGDTTLVRVNPDYPLASNDLSDSVISIMSRGLKAIKKIDQFYRSL